MIFIIKERTENIIAGDFTSESINVGSIRTLNILMLGVAAARYIPLKKESIAEAIRQSVKKNLIEINLNAFNKGCEIT